MSQFKNTLIFLLVIAMLPLSSLKATESGGLTLLEGHGAKPAALAEAYSAVTNDLSVMGYNPAGLVGLESGQASFLYNKGAAEDTFGRFSIATPTRKASLGLSLGYYNAGELEINDGSGTRSVTAQKDMTLSLTGAKQMGSLGLGITGKYLQSELIDQYSARAYAADFGMNMKMSGRLTIGGAIQNLGTGLKFIEKSDPLPRIYRGGVSYLLTPGRSYSTTLLLDMPYFANEQEIRPSLGLDVSLGLLSLRSGFRKLGDENEFSLGTGISFSRSTLDYSFGLANNLDASHKISFSMQFGSGPSASAVPFVKRPQTRVYEAKTAKKSQPVASSPARHTIGKISTPKPTRRIYQVQQGDTLATIAKKEYGNANLWEAIYSANKHIIDNPRKVEAGTKIILPY